MAAYSFNQYPFNRNNIPSSNSEQDQVALFIDWDNLVISNYADRGGNRPDLSVLVRQAQQYGTVVVARAYAEWNITADRLEVYKAGVEPIYAPVFHADRDLSGQTGKGKSLADPVMVTDCIDFLHLLPQVGTYVLVTGDKDMVPVVRLARLRGRRVVVIGPDYVANVLQQVSDEFILYRYLLAQAVPADPYAAYYQQTGQYYTPGQPLPQGYYPPQMPAAQQPQTNQQTTGNDRRTRRLSGRRGQSASNYPAPPMQPYARIVAPPPGGVPAPQQPTAPVVPGYNYYGLPGQGQTYPATNQPELYQQPGAYPQPVPGYAAPGYTVPGATTGTTPAPAAPEATSGQVTPVAQSTQAYQPTPTYQSPAQALPSIAQPTPVSVEPTTAAKSGVGDFSEVTEAVRQILASRAGTGRAQMRARDLKEELLRRIPNFSERRYGFSKFKALLSAAESAGVLQIDQSGHILWVSAPGTPKGQFGAPPALPETAAVAAPELDEEDETEVVANPTAEADLLNAEEPVAVAGPNALQTQPAPNPVVVEPEEARLVEPAPEETDEVAEEAAIEAPAQPTGLPEERTTSLVEAPIGAHRPAGTRPVETPSTAPAAPRRSGARPSLLDQPYYEDVIVLIDELRSRHRWLGYELLLSNVRDLLAKAMPESEAKGQAGIILSKLLNEGIIKMAVEVHSRGARKTTVKAAHLQDQHPTVRYALEQHKAAQQSQAVAEPVQESVPELAAPTQELTYADVDLPTQPEEQAAVEAETQPSQEAPESYYWGSHYTRQPHPVPAFEEVSEVQATTAVEDYQAAPTEPTYEAAVEPVQQEGYQPEQSAAEPTREVQPEQQAAPTEAQPETVEAQGEPPVEVPTEVPTEVTGHEVVALVAESPEAPLYTGEQVQGEPEHTPQGEEAAPAGGFINTVELHTPEAPEHTNGHDYHHPAPEGVEGDGKQPAAETLQAEPVAELDGEEVEGEEVEEGEAVAHPAARRPRRPRRPAAAPVNPEGSGESESMGQPGEARQKLTVAQRNHRRRNHNKK